MEITEEQT